MRKTQLFIQQSKDGYFCNFVVTSSDKDWIFDDCGSRELLFHQFHVHRAVSFN